jgi:tRNA pseudouridine32 synthase/23S rRNA pseudouridine746 synthase
MVGLPDKFHSFDSKISTIDLPDEFTYPFYYTPHSLAELASKQVQEYLTHQKDFNHKFGFDPAEEKPIGKMFGVLVVKSSNGQIGFLAAFSGKLADSNEHHYFVPPVFDVLPEEGFFKQGEQVLNVYTQQIEELENANETKHLLDEINHLKNQKINEIQSFKTQIKENKKKRDEVRRSLGDELSKEKNNEILSDLNAQSQKEQLHLKYLAKSWNARITQAEENYEELKEKIEQLKSERKTLSAQLQKEIFSNYTFLNAKGENLDLFSIFKETVWNTPPAGAGECAAPKLLQYAYLHDLNPIAMAEFWWGASPTSEIRKHGTYYPSCRGKCEPILGHMLQGLKVERNPLEDLAELEEPIEIIFEDEHLLVINKPHEFLSVPGKQNFDSVYQRMKEYLPESTGPLIVHRLDMSTSGLMVIAKTLEIYKQLQYQFISRRVKKSYIALLEGVVKQPKGVIDLPLRVNLEDRPRQLVCYEHGKNAMTEFEVLEIRKRITRIRFYPITGRTHQLRVHASHPSGLNVPIMGDDLYGNKGERLHLHAEQLNFKHPFTKEVMSFQKDPSF